MTNIFWYFCDVMMLFCWCTSDGYKERILPKTITNMCLLFHCIMSMKDCGNSN